MSLFDKVTLAAPDAIFGLTAAYIADRRSNKVNLMVGYYRNADLKTPVLNTVKKAERFLAETSVSKEYLPFAGDKTFVERSGMLVFGEKLWHASSNRMHGAQTVGGTGALKIGGDFLKQEVSDSIYLSDPTWPNHRGVFTRCGFNVKEYPYYDRERNVLDFDRLLKFLSDLKPKEIVVLHSCCHNPTGCDLSLEQWKIVSDLILKKKLVPFFDSAYQGFAKGVDEDAQSIRMFVENGHEMLIACSYAKNFSLYGERVGVLFVVAGSPQHIANVGSRINSIIRTTYSNPPMHGAQIVAHILNDAALKKEWESELSSMRERIMEMRKAFVSALSAQSKQDFSFLNDRNGLFCFSGLTKEQVDHLISEYGIYMTGDGRINIAGLNQDNLDYVVNAISAVLQGVGP